MAEYLEAFVVEGFDQPFGIKEQTHLPLYDSAYAGIRDVLRPEYRNLSDAEIDALLRPILGRMSPEEVEGFWDTVVGVAKQVAPVILPAAGAALGTFIGGPVGTAIGGQLGQMGAQLVAGPKPPSAPPAAAPQPAAPPAVVTPATAPQPPAAQPSVAQPSAPQPAPEAPAAAAAPVPPGGSSAANQLMALIQNPALLKSLLGQVLGAAGQQTVPAGSQGTQLSFPALMNALSSLAGKAAQEAAEAYPGIESVEATGYLVDTNGNFLVDPADPDARAQRVMELLREDYLAKAYEPAGASFDPVTEWFIEADLVK